MEIKLLSCPLCLKPHFAGVDALRSSLISVATSTLKCPVCNDTLLGLDKLTIHLFTHISETNNIDDKKNVAEIDDSIKKIDEEPTTTTTTDAQIKCDICNFSFTDQTILDMHTKLLHQTIPDKDGLYNYHCHLCSKKFRKRGSLMVHLRVAHYGFVGHHDDLNSTPSSSSLSTTIEDLLANNQRNQDNNNKQWECDVCQKMFTTKYFLKKHKRLHTGEMPYFCNQCNKSFTFQQSYHKHMLYHSSEKPYNCNECGRAFKELSTLQNHARIHSGERPFACETCGKRFRQRVSYLVHQRIHTGVMPYKCTACNKYFRYKVSQRSHKCPVNPPGSVIKINETNPNSNNDNNKFIMSVDYNTGNINLIRNNQDPATDKEEENGNTKQNNSDDLYTNQPDLFSMVLSPSLPNVEALCLTNALELSQQSSNNHDNSIDESLKLFME